MKSYPRELSESYLIPVIIAVICLGISTNLTIKQIACNQVNYVVGYLLNGIIIYFAWNIN
jgi:hypothetical protein